MRSLRDGTPPDPRFTLANERTFLAWIRTALGLVAAAAVLDGVGDHLVDGPSRRLLVALTLGGAAVVAVQSAARWRGVEARLRAGEAPAPARWAVLLMTGFVLGLGVAVLL